MKTKIVNLSREKFSIEGEVNERLPRYTKDLVAHFPCDNTLQNAIPEFELSVIDNKIITRGIFKDAIIENKTIIENNMIKIDGTVNSYLLLNKDLLNGADDFSIEMEVLNVGSSNDSAWLMSCINRNKDAKNIDLGFYIKQSTGTFHLEMLNVSSESATDGKSPVGYYSGSSVGDVPKRALTKIKIMKNAGFLTISINDEVKDSFIVYGSLDLSDIVVGQLSNKSYSSASHNFNNSNSFNGYISKIKVCRFEKLYDADVSVSEFGTMSGVSLENLLTNEISYYLWNSNITGPVHRLTDAGYTIGGNDVYTVNFSSLPETDDYKTKIRSGTYRHGVKSNTYSFETGKVYCSYILYKPVSHNDMRLLLTAANIAGWQAGHEGIPIGNGWYLAYKFRETSAPTGTDRIFYSAKIPSYSNEEPISFECSPVFLIEGSKYPNFITYNGIGAVSNPEIRQETKLLKYLNMTNGFSLCADIVFTGESTKELHPYIFWIGQFSTDNSKDWIGIFRGEGWTQGKYIGINTISKNKDAFENIVGVDFDYSHEHHIALSYDKANKKMSFLVYDKIDKKIVYETEMTKDSFDFENFEYLSLNRYSQSFMKNISFYEKPLPLSTLKENIKDSFSISSEGNLTLDKVSEHANDVSGAYYCPMGVSGESTDGSVQNTADAAFPAIDGGSFAGRVTTGTVLHLMRDVSYSPILDGEVPWDYSKHSDAMTLNGWNNGYYSSVENPEVGYHAKITLDGINKRPSLKFIGYNGEINKANRYMVLRRNVTASELPLKVGDKLLLLYKAKSNKAGDGLKVSIKKSYLAGNDGAGNDHVYQKFTNDWKEYSLLVTVGNDWDLTKSINASFERSTANSIEETVTVCDATLILNPGYPEALTSEIVYHVSIDKRIQYNLASSIGMDWTKPWQIMYRKKMLDGTIHSLDAFGSHAHAYNTPYLYTGNYLGKHTFNYTNNGSAGLYIEIDNKPYINKWEFISIRYDGSGTLTANIIGDTFNVQGSSVNNIITSGFKSDFGFDIALGNYQVSPTNIMNGAAIIKDLVIIKNKTLSSDETKRIGQMLMSYKTNELIASVQLVES